MTAWIRFPVFLAASYITFGVVLCFALRRRGLQELRSCIAWVGLIVVVGGMTFAKLGQNAGWPWGVYYTVPLLLTLVLPPLYFKMNRSEVAEYLVLSLVSAPLIHVLFSFFVGWKEYLPFLEVPSLWEWIS